MEELRPQPRFNEMQIEFPSSINVLLLDTGYFPKVPSITLVEKR